MKRSDKSVSFENLPSPLEPMFPMGSKKYQPIPDNVIYTVYAECEETGYANVTTNPFFNGREIRNEMKVPCSFNIISPDSTFESEGTIRLIGFGSRTYKKLSWSMQFSDKKFYGRKTVKMRGLASDDSFMREKLATSLYKSAGVPVQEGAYARLIINDDIYGLYLISDTLNKKWLSNYVHGDDKAKIGFSYKLISSTPNGPYCDLKYYGEDYEVYEDMGVYEVDEFEKENVDPEDESTQWTYLINFTKLFKQWIEKYENDTSDKAVEELEKFLNLESLLRLMAIDTLILPLDNFWLIMSNSEIYYNPDDKRYQFLPFDFDQSLVGSWEISSLNPNNYIKDCITWANYDESINDHYFINNLLKHPQIKERYDIILAKISNNTFDAKTINEYLKSIASLIRDDIQWNIDANNNLNIPYDGDITYLTLDQFDSNYSYRERNKKDNERVRDSYELQEFVNIRGDYCRAYTANIKNYENSKIIDDQKKSAEYHFSVVSILGEGYTMGVKYGDNVVPLDIALFPLYNGTIHAENLKEYKYVALNKKNEIVIEENISRIYTNETINEVFNRTTIKNVSIPELPSPLEPIYPMGNKNYQPIPDNVIYTVYAKCEEAGYANVTTNPFFNGRKIRNDMKVPCTFSIISPDSTFESKGTIRLTGYSSRLFKKLSWNIIFTSKKFFGRKTVKMRGIANDESLMREKLATSLYKSAGVPVQEGAYARFIINDDIYGLYLITDTLNKNWLSNYVHGNNKAKIGFSYKLISSVPDGPYCDLKYYGENYEVYEDMGVYEVDEYEKENVNPKDESTQWTSLIKFTKLFDNWVKTYSNDFSDKAVEELEKFLDVESLLRLMTIDTLVLPLDNFWIIMSNTGLYYNPEKGRYQFLPYDFSQSLVGSWGISSLNPANYMKDCITWANYDESINDHYFINNIMKHPQIVKRYNTILEQISNQTYESKTINNYLKAIASLIREDVQWNIDA
eukprot:jgi/Orpsp1_1/1185530/evm.model.c7180000094265.1